MTEFEYYNPVRLVFGPEEAILAPGWTERVERQL